MHFFQNEKIQMEHAIQWLLSIFQHVLRIFARLKIFRRYSKIFRDPERSSKVKYLFGDFCKISQRYCKDILFFTGTNNLKTFKNLFKILIKLFVNLGSLKIKGLERSSWRLFKDFSEIKTVFLSNIIKDRMYLPQKVHQVATSKKNQNYLIFSGCPRVFFPGNIL